MSSDSDLLKDYQGAEYTLDDPDPLEREKTSVQQLHDSDSPELGDFRIRGEIYVVCEDCNT